MASQPENQVDRKTGWLRDRRLFNVIAASLLSMLVLTSFLQPIQADAIVDDPPVTTTAPGGSEADEGTGEDLPIPTEPEWEITPEPEAPDENPEPVAPIDDANGSPEVTIDPVVAPEEELLAPADASDPNAFLVEEPLSIVPMDLAEEPVVTPNSTLIRVKTGGIREAQHVVQPLDGVVLRLYRQETGNLANMSAPITEAWGTCTSGEFVSGQCIFQVPATNTGGANRNAQLVIVQETQPAGWFKNPDLRIGPGNAAYLTPYQWVTPQLRGGQTLTTGTNNFMNKPISTNAPRETSGGIWQTSLDNPTYECRVGLRVALVLDLSSSVRNTLGDLKQAANGFVHALAGTGSSVALYTFSNAAPSAQNSVKGKNYPMVPLDEGNNLATTISNINKYEADGATNWDQGIYQVAQSSQQYDIALIVTDGMPTVSGPRTNSNAYTDGPGHSTYVRAVEAAIFSANALKNRKDPNIQDHEGTRLIVVGVGNGTSGSPINLAAISGPKAFEAGVTDAVDADYFQVEWEQLEAALENIADTAICSARVTVVKQTKSGDNANLQDGGAGWEFDMNTTEGAYWVSNSGFRQNRVTSPDSTTSDLLFYTSSDADSVTVSITEIMTPDQANEWVLAEVDCTVNGVVVSLGLALEPELTVSVGDDVVCTFVNAKAAAGITLVKRGWATDDPTKVATVAAVDPSVQEIMRNTNRPLNEQVTWTYDVTNTSTVLITNIVLADNRLLASDLNCPQTELAGGKTMRCTGTGSLIDTSGFPDG